jgi:hypothetical protein
MRTFLKFVYILVQTWIYRFTLECATVVADRTLSAETPSLATIMELDRKVQDFPTITTGPLASMETAAETVSLSMRRLVMVQVKGAREIALPLSEVSRQLMF